MLRSFRLSNHRSFLDEQQLLLMPSATSRAHEALTVAAIYGANASGKSNLLDGLRFMAMAVRDSFQRWDADGGVKRNPFRLGQQGLVRPSTFVVEIVVGDVPYTYGFSVDDQRVVEEWLYSYPEKKRRILFEREGSSLKFGTTVKQVKSRFAILEDLTRDNALFLSVAAQSNLASMMSVYRWFAHDLVFRSTGHEPAAVTAGDVAAYLGQNNAGTHRRLVNLLAAADTGIADVRVRSESSPHGGPVWDLNFVHGDMEDFDIEDESEGTRNWLGMLPPILDVLDHGSTFVVDEIDASLHPLLTVKLLQLFAGVETNPKRAQLIFTTHDTTPLGSYVGREVLQRDQVWFVEKDSEGRSQLYPLSDFKPRIGENAEKRYLGGSYGAVPVLSDLEFGA